VPSYITPRLVLLAACHFTIDAYSSFFAPLLPLLVAKLDLSLTLVGTLVAFSSLSTSFAQPLFGLLSDRLSRPWFVGFGPLAAAVFISAVGVAPDYWSLVVLLLLGGLGVAAFHPEAAALAAEASPPRRGMAMALFVTGGTLGFALGPLLAVGVVSAFGLERSWLAALPGLVVAALMVSWFMRVRPTHRPKEARPRLAALRPVLRPLMLLYFAVVSRSAVSYGFMTFLPLHLTAKGYGLAPSGLIVSLYLGAGALGGLLGGWLADRWGGRRVVVASFVGGLPLYFAFLLLPDPASLACLVVGSFVLQTSLPVNVVMGQELSPRHSSTIASLLMGAAWGLGALIASPVGALADAWGLQTALLALAFVLIGGLGCACALPATRPPLEPAELAQPAGGVAGR
jgi:FSR family fosmidomycin resistance protein-like MFS transporter